MLTVVLAGFSLLLGILIGAFGSVALVVYFSAAAATIIALLKLSLGGSIGTVVLAWFATILAVQCGFVLATIGLALARSQDWTLPRPPTRKDPVPALARDRESLGSPRRTASGMPAVPADRHGAPDL